MHKVLVKHLGGLRLPRKSVVRLTDSPNMTKAVYCGSKSTTTQQQQRSIHRVNSWPSLSLSFCRVKKRFMFSHIQLDKTYGDFSNQ